MVPFGLIAMLTLGIFMVVFGAGFFGGLLVFASVAVGSYLAVKNPEMLKP